MLKIGNILSNVIDNTNNGNRKKWAVIVGIQKQGTPVSDYVVAYMTTKINHLDMNDGFVEVEIKDYNTYITPRLGYIHFETLEKQAKVEGMLELELYNQLIELLNNNKKEKYGCIRLAKRPKSSSS
jgi:hypothetical protein